MNGEVNAVVGKTEGVGESDINVLGNMVKTKQWRTENIFNFRC